MASLNTEVKGSGREWENGRFSFGERLFVALTEGEQPIVGGKFDDTYGQDAEDDRNALRCTQVNKDIETLPGLYLFRAIYQAFKAK